MKKPQRQKQYEAMLDEAQKRPGIREVMEVYQDWREADKGLDPYRMLQTGNEEVTTTNHANPQ